MQTRAQSSTAVLLSGGEANRELLIAGGGETAHTIHQLVGRARRGQVPDERGSKKALFLWAGPDEVSLVEREVARRRGLVAIVEPAILADGGRERLGHADLERAVHHAVEERQGEGAGLGASARAIGGLAIVQHAAHRERGLVQRGRVTPCRAAAFRHLADVALRAREAAHEGQPAIGDVGGERARPRAERRHVKRDPLADGEEAAGGVEKAHRARRAFGLPLYGLAGQEPLHHAHVLAQIVEAHRGQAHGIAGREPGTHAEVDAARRELAERGQAVGRRGRDAVGGHEHPRTEPDAARLGRGQGHRDKDVGAEHLRVVEPGVREPQLLSALRNLPAVNARSDPDSELHRRCPPSPVGPTTPRVMSGPPAYPRRRPARTAHAQPRREHQGSRKGDSSLQARRRCWPCATPTIRSSWRS